MKLIKWNNNIKKIMCGSVWWLLLVFLVPITNVLAALSYSDMIVKPIESSNAVSTSDAKFMNNHIITGVSGKLTILSTDRKAIASFPEVDVNWLYSIEDEGLIVYGNNSKKIGIAKVIESGSGGSVSYKLASNDIIYNANNLCIDPTIIHVNGYYYITFTEIIGRVNNPTSYTEDNAKNVNGEYILHMWRIKEGSDFGDRSLWEEVSVIQDNFHNTEDIDIMYSSNHFTVLFEYENYDKGCSAIRVIESMDSEGRSWGEPKELIPNDADHEMASVWDEGDHYTLWYSCDRDAVGQSYMAGKVYYATFDKSWKLLSKDNVIQGDYSRIGGVRLYDVKKIDGKINLLYAKNYLKENILSVLRESPHNEWIAGKWYDVNGDQNYPATLSWKKNGNGWWAEDSSGWYPVSCWQKIDGKWYFFDASGYMSSNEWVAGYWLSSNGALEYSYTASWKQNSTGWWYEDTSGWYPSSCWQRIDGKWYYFDTSGYMVTSQYIDGYWIGDNGACK